MSVKRGDPLVIKASDWNALLSVADAAKLQQVGQLRESSTFSGASGVVVPVKNATGSTVSRYHAMGIGTPLFDHSDNAQTFLNQLGFSGAATSSSYLGRFAVAQETIANGKIGACLVNGITAAQITVNHADHDRVDVDTAGGAKLVSQFYGAGEIIYKESGTGTKWALIRVGNFVEAELQAIADEDISVNGTGDVRVQRNGSDSETVTAQLSWMAGAQSVATSDQLLIRFFRDQNAYVIIGAGCP